jgi:peroxiredoxin
MGASLDDKAPDFQLAGLDGAQLQLADLHGSPVVLVFWTASCPVGEEEAPDINRAHQPSSFLTAVVSSAISATNCQEIIHRASLR